MKSFNFLITCVNAIGEDIEAMVDKSVEITFKTFYKNCDCEELIKSLGYAFGPGVKGLRINKDYHVKFYKSKYKGKPCYFIVWSGIEHVFINFNSYLNEVI